MGSFVTSTSLANLMIGTDFDKTATANLASECITDAENEVIKYLGKKFDTSGWITSAATPPIVVTIGQWFSIGFMYEGLARGGNNSYARADRYIDRAMKNIELIMKGKVDLTDSSGSMVSERTDTLRVLSSTEDYEPTFNEDDPINYKIDPDKLDDIADDRA